MLHVYRILGGKLPFKPDTEQLHIDMVDHIDRRRQDALARQERRPELTYPLQD